VEVTTEGEIAWEFFNPDRVPRRDGDGELIAIIASARRVQPEALEADFIAPPF
jgi:hypothetical protein